MTEEKKAVGGSDVIFKPIDIELERLFAAPEKNDTTRIATLLAKCVVPVRIGVLDVPKKILAHIKEVGRNSETILPLASVRVYHTILKLEHRMAGSNAEITLENAANLFVPDAVKSATRLVDDFWSALTTFCREIETVQGHIASEKSFYMAQTLGTEMTVDPSLILTAAQNFIQALNVTASGLNGYVILALVQTIDTIGKLMDDPDMQELYSAMNQTAIVNKLGFRILPGHVALHKQMNELLDITMKAGDSSDIDKTTLVKLFNLTNLITKSSNLITV